MGRGQDGRPRSLGEQRFPGHFRRLRHAHQGQQRGGDIGQFAISERMDRGRGVEQQCRDPIQRVLGVLLVGFLIEHLFGIAVVGGDEHDATGLADRGHVAGHIFT